MHTWHNAQRSLYAPRAPAELMLIIVQPRTKGGTSSPTFQSGLFDSRDLKTTEESVYKGTDKSVMRSCHLVRDDICHLKALGCTLLVRLAFLWVDCTFSLLQSSSLAPLLVLLCPFPSTADHPGVTRVSADVRAHAGRSVPRQESGHRVEWEEECNSYLARSFTSTFVSFWQRATY